MGCVLVAVLLLGHQSVCVGENYDVYLLAGQSNMDGRGLASELSDAQNKPIEQAIIFYRNPTVDGEGWQPLSPKFSKAPKKYKGDCLLYTSPSPRDQRGPRMPSSA